MRKILFALCFIALPLKAEITAEQLETIFGQGSYEAIDFFEGKYDERLLALMQKTGAFEDPYTFENWQSILSAFEGKDMYVERALKMIEADDGTNDHIITDIENLTRGLEDVDN